MRSKKGRIMQVTLLQNTSLTVCASAIRTCWQSFDKSDNGGPKDCELIDRVGNKFKHASPLEHLVYTFYIQGISRALLQELSRHRIASLSVKSTRYTLKELKAEESFTCKDFERAKKYLVFTGDERVDCMSIKALENLRLILNEGISNDKAKYCLPESYKTELTWTINARSLQNFLTLRSDKSALWEIQNLAHALYESLPQEHKYLFSIKESQ
jgi:thymidylate synthase (FAD)